MHQLENTLFIMTQGAYLRLDHDTLRVDIEGETKLQVPLHHLSGIVCFGNVAVSPFLIHECAEQGLSITWLSNSGRFKARMVGPTKGNVLLRCVQHETASDPEKSLNLAKNIIAGKIKNTRQIMLRAARETSDSEDQRMLHDTSESLASALNGIPQCNEIETLRGIEGDAARIYFGTFDRMVLEDRQSFRMNGRSKRPPLDRMNALLSFLYTLLVGDVVGALEGVGLDPQIGFLHVMRPGRPALALDMMEEFRAVLADRLALTLINQRQIQAKHFEEKTGGAVLLNEEGRKTLVVAYQKRKQDEIHHPVLDKKAPFALLPHLQARLLARYLRGDTEEYIPFLYR